MKSSLIILSFFATGLLLGIFRLLPEVFFNEEISFYVLCCLMFTVGFSIGHQGNLIWQFRRLNPRIVFLPLFTIAGTWLGALAVVFFINDFSLFDALAASSGFGYYSLSGILITRYKGVELGTIALMSNIVREILTLLFAPLMVKYFGKFSPISSGGATTMDTTFPVIVQTAGKDYALVSIYHGFVMDFSVPFLVTFWCSL